jgi:hypothetical protein
MSKLIKNKIWKTPNLVEKISELISQGFLKKGVDELVKEVNRTLFEDKNIFRKTHFFQGADDVIWTKDRLTLLKKFVMLDAQLDPVYKEFDFLPKEIVIKKAKKLRGKSIKKKKYSDIGAGMGRLVTEEEVKKHSDPPALTAHRLDNPFPIPVKNDENFRIFVINAPHLGLEYNRILEENALRNMFREAERNHDDAIIISGALLWVDAKKSSGFLTTHRSLYSGLDFDPSVLPKAYRRKAIEIKKMNPPDMVCFAKLRERVLNAMAGWNKVSHLKSGGPIYSGKVYFSFGYQEEEIINSAAHAEILYITTKMRNEVLAERKLAEALLSSMYHRNGGHETSETAQQKQLIEDLLEEEKRMIQSNVDPNDRKRFVDAIRSVLISWLKDAIPNSEFLSQGSVVCKIGKKTIEIIQSPENNPVSSSLDGYMKVGGQRSLENKLPDMALVAAPCNIDARWGVLEKMDGVDRGVTHAWQLPVAIDRDYLRKARPEMIRKASPIEKLIRDTNFEPGAFRLGYVNGVWVPEPLPISFFNVHRSKTMASRTISEYIYIVADGDNHAGMRSKVWIPDGDSGFSIPIEVALSELLLRSFTQKGKPIPAHMYVNLADDLQGHHFPTQQTIHHLAKPYIQAEALVRKLLVDAEKSGNPEDIKKMLRMLSGEYLQQLRFRGEDWLTNQFEDFVETSLRPRVPLFEEILKNGIRVGLKIRGVGEVLSGSSVIDSRDIGLVNLISGDHVGHTTNEEIAEGVLYRRTLIGFLLGSKNLGVSEDVLNKLVCAPNWGNFSVGYGLISVPGGYEWGVALRHKPTASSGKNGDRMQGIVDNLAERGDYSRIFSGRNFLQLSGHTHFYSAAFSRKKFMVSCASSTEGDAFGDMLGFRKNNAGSVIVGIPVKGPEFGPIRIIPFTHAFLLEYFKNPWEINWDSVFQDPVGF